MKQQKLLVWSCAVFILSVLIGLFGCGIAAPNVQPSDAASTDTLVKKDGTLTLHLDVPHDSFSMKPAANLPPGVIDVQLPIHPNAISSNLPFDLADKNRPATPYLKAAAAEYVLPISDTEVQSWYKEHMTFAGFKQMATMQAGNSKTGEWEESIEFLSTKDSGLHVSLSFQQVKTDQTLLMYWAYEVVQLPRPADSLLPTDMSKVDIQYHPAERSKAIVQKTITDPAALEQLVTAINSLPLDLSGARSCTADLGQGATMHFVETKGQTFDVTLRAACGDVSVNHGRNFYDSNDIVWKTVTALMEKN